MATAAGTGARQIDAAAVRERGGAFRIEKLMLEKPRRDEVLVKIVALGDGCVSSAYRLRHPG